MRRSLEAYWRRAKSGRLVRGERANRSRRYVVLGDSSEENGAKPRRSWRIRVSRRLQVLRKLGSPRRLLTRLRDAYVSMMMGFPGSAALAGGGPFDFYGARPAAKEYDPKMIVQIYRSMVAENRLVPRPSL